MDDRVERANLPGRKAMAWHPFYRGKVEIVPKAPVTSMEDFGVWYTPGVADPCRDIARDPDRVWYHTNRWNTIAVVSDGTRVLGLGDIGPEAALPVMEGKAMLFKYLGGVDAVPLCLDTKDEDAIVETVKRLAPSFGGINLEDIASPKCFSLLDRLREGMPIPVWHDDQQGTATIEVAGAINALKLVGKSLSDARFCMVGSGAANIAIIRLLHAAGVPMGHMVVVDSRGVLGTHRRDIENRRAEFPQKWDLCLRTNPEGVEGGIVDGMRGADIVIAASRPGPGTISKEAVRAMASDAIVFATANPVPEIWPWEAEEAGARIIATGRSDFPNQINNSLGFPGIFRGALDVMARTITDEMCLAAAYELAKTAEEKALTETHIVPTMEEWEVFPREAAAVGAKAVEQGVARLKLSREECYERAETVIRRARETTAHLMRGGFIPPPPEVF